MNLSYYYLLLQRLGLLEILYSICRIIFYLINWPQFKGASYTVIGAAFLNGLFFDLATILLINLPVIVLSVLPFDWVTSFRFQSRLSILFQLINIPFLLLNIINAGYFQFAGKVLTPADGQSVQHTTKEQVLLLVFDYWYVAVLALVMLFLLVWYDPSYYDLKPKRAISRMWSFFGIFISLAITILFFAIVLKKNPTPAQDLTSPQATAIESLSRNATFNLLASQFYRATRKIDDNPKIAQPKMQ